MPVNKRFPLTELMDACRQYQLNTAPKKRRITFEWAAMAGKNDSP
jgi:23S rRNA (adenine2503-C2)-methyltransferase